MDYAQLYPFLGITARGKFGNLWIHKLYKERFWNNHPDYPQDPARSKMLGNQGRVITKYYYPENPRTAKQQGNRSTFSDGLYNWSQFDKNTKNYYDELKRPIFAYGIHRYISLYMLANPNMIIYWNTLEKSATDPARLPDYMSTEYFGGVSRVLASTTYPATSPYGALRYRSDLKKFVGFKQDSGWGEIGGVPVTSLNIVNIVNNYKARAYLTSTLSLATGGPTKINLGTENYDPNSNYDKTTNYRYDVPVNGYYDVTFQASIWTDAGKRYLCYIAVNGVVVAEVATSPYVATVNGITVHTRVYCTAGQYIEPKMYHDSAGNKDVVAGTASTFMDIHLVSV